MAFFSVLKKVHWSDVDAAGVAWFARYLGWFEDADEELYIAALGRTRQSLMDDDGFWMPRVEAHVRFESFVPNGTLLRIAIEPAVENPRRLRHRFEIWSTSDQRRVAHGFVRIACVSVLDRTPQDFPQVVHTFVDRVNALGAAQANDWATLPWV